MRTVRETLYRAACAGCRTAATLVVASGPKAETDALAQVEATLGWERRDYGNGLLLVCPSCAAGHPVLADCQVAGHDWDLVSTDQATSNLVCLRCEIGPAHQPVPDSAAAGLRSRPRTDPNAWWSPAGGGGIDTLEVVEHRLRDLGAPAAAMSGSRS